nr:MAG TPA: hypothetical protein [Caudoviricetes sp.]
MCIQFLSSASAINKIYCIIKILFVNLQSDINKLNYSQL